MTFSALLAGMARTRPDRTAVVDDRVRLTYAALDAHVTRAAAGLAARGIGPGDAVACILPNRAEAVVLFYAASRIGAVLVPIVPIYGAREVRFILRQVDAKLLVIPRRHRRVDFEALVERVRPDVPSLHTVLALGDAFETPWDIANAPERPTPDTPEAIRVVLYTSGTTADPKGALHNDRTLFAECRSMVDYHGLGDDHVFVMPSPVSHISGLLYGVMLPVVLGATSVLMETWDPDHFCALVARERGTYSAGATPFLQGVLDCATRARHDLSSLRLFPCGGADVPPDLIRRAIRELRVRSGRGYGSTELPSITSSAGPLVPDAKRAETDGAPIGGNVVELRDGEIWARGPELFLGYKDVTLDRDAFDDRGFFRTGDLGVLDADGYLTITGRVKDIIIRRGEKLSAKEIEDLLYEHPKVRAVAVIPSPDPEVGERVCAIVVPADAASPPVLADLVAFLEGRELSRRKLPERLVLVDELPMTASGKVQKHVLRATLRHLPSRR